MTSTRRQITPAEFVKGAHVYKGNGKTLYRIAGVATYQGIARAMVVKATTAKDPHRGCWYPITAYTVDA
jgi:hypothetical protein